LDTIGVTLKVQSSRTNSNAASMLPSEAVQRSISKPGNRIWVISAGVATHRRALERDDLTESLQITDNPSGSMPEVRRRRRSDAQTPVRKLCGGGYRNAAGSIAAPDASGLLLMHIAARDRRRAVNKSTPRLSR